jgi:hypothetical protein
MPVALPDRPVRRQRVVPNPVRQINSVSQTSAGEGIETDPYRKFIVNKDIEAPGIVMLLANSSDCSDRHDGV